jgi:hypothetical protein
MAPRRVVVLTSLLTLVWTAAAHADAPRPGIQLSGKIQFPRPQSMAIKTDPKDGSRLTVALGFDGRCRGGGIGELWMSFVPARGSLRVKDGVFAGRLTGTSSVLRGVAGRTAAFTWRLSGRFTDAEVATATVAGSAVVRSGSRVISRCTIARPASVRLTRGD